MQNLPPLELVVRQKLIEKAKANGKLFVTLLDKEKTILN
jgi:hypothetical protein